MYRPARRVWLVSFSLVGLLAAVRSDAAPPHGGDGPRGHADAGQRSEFVADRADFQSLLRHRHAIRRRVENLENGVRTTTESDDPDVAARIGVHVESMLRRVEEGRPIHARDPLFAELFRHSDRITAAVEATEHGVVVTETSDDPYVVRLIQEHAKVVSQFVEKGPQEVRKNHAAPPRGEPKMPQMGEKD